MVKSVATDFSLIYSQRDLKWYCDELEERHGPLELRYLAHTSLDGTQSILASIPKMDDHYELLIPHFWLAPYLRKDIVLKKQRLEELIYKGLQKKATLLMRSYAYISEIKVDNTNPFVLEKKHTKHLVRITNYEKYDWRHRDFGLSMLIEPPVWVNKFLLKSIFNKVSVVQDEPRNHSQLSAFSLFSQSQC